MASWLNAERPLGKLARIPLGLIPAGTVVPILATPARGKRWIAGSGPHSCWLGWNEISKRRHFARAVRPGDVIYDVGANVGSYTILASVLVGKRGRVVAFEPLAENVAYLERHVSLNTLSNVDVVPAAVGELCGVSHFRRHADRLQGRLDSEGDELVPVIALDDFVSGGAPPPACIKIDVEGGETAVLEGARRVLEDVRPLVFLATHSEEVREECRALLGRAGYGMAPIGRSGDEWICRAAVTRTIADRAGA